MSAIPLSVTEAAAIADYEHDVANAIRKRDWLKTQLEIQTMEIERTMRELREWEEDVIDCQRRLTDAKERGVR